MNNSSVRELARRAGVAVQWTDRFGKRHRVSLDTIRHILAALQLPCQTPDDIRHSRRALDNATIPPLVTATLGRVIDLPWRMPDAPPRARLIRDDGAATDVLVRQTSRGIRLQGVKAIGYHTLDIGQARTTLAVAPARCIGIADIANRERLAGVAAQIYGLRHAGDCGIGDMSGVAALAQAAAARGLEIPCAESCPRPVRRGVGPVQSIFAVEPTVLQSSPCRCSVGFGQRTRGPGADYGRSGSANTRAGKLTHCRLGSIDASKDGGSPPSVRRLCRY